MTYAEVITVAGLVCKSHRFHNQEYIWLTPRRAATPREKTAEGSHNGFHTLGVCHVEWNP